MPMQPEVARLLVAGIPAKLTGIASEPRCSELFVIGISHINTEFGATDLSFEQSREP
jgi:hypothetical protein